jgi:hypothetical protein
MSEGKIKLTMHLQDSHSEIVRTEMVSKVPELVVLDCGGVKTVYRKDSTADDAGDITYVRQYGALKGLIASYHSSSVLSFDDPPLKPFVAKKKKK